MCKSIPQPNSLWEPSKARQLFSEKQVYIYSRPLDQALTFKLSVVCVPQVRQRRTNRFYRFYLAIHFPTFNSPHLKLRRWENENWKASKHKRQQNIHWCQNHKKNPKTETIPRVTSYFPFPNGPSQYTRQTLSRWQNGNSICPVLPCLSTSKWEQHVSCYSAEKKGHKCAYTRWRFSSTWSPNSFETSSSKSHVRWCMMSSFTHSHRSWTQYCNTGMKNSCHKSCDILNQLSSHQTILIRLKWTLHFKWHAAKSQQPLAVHIERLLFLIEWKETCQIYQWCVARPSDQWHRTTALGLHTHWLPQSNFASRGVEYLWTDLISKFVNDSSRHRVSRPC